MKRDMDLIRAILLKLEADIDSQPTMYDFHFDNQKLVIPGYSDAHVYEHLMMLLDSPFIVGKPMSGGAIVNKLTWEGHEFLDAVRDSVVWAKIKGGAEKVGGVGLGFMWEIGKSIVKSEIKTRLGMALD